MRGEEPQTDIGRWSRALALLEQGVGQVRLRRRSLFFGPQVETSVECVKNGGQAFTFKMPYYHGVCAHDINAYESVGT